MPIDVLTIENISKRVAESTPFNRDRVRPFVSIIAEYIVDDGVRIEALRKIMFAVDTERVRYAEAMAAKRDANAVREQNG